jgi:hypothetical protein
MRGIRAQLDQQQALLVDRLREANGAPVTFEELRRIGIENPALLCYELAAVGLPVTRTSSAREGMPALSVRLEHRGEAIDERSGGPSPPVPDEGLDAGPDASPAGAEALQAAAAHARGWVARARPRLTRPARGAPRSAGRSRRPILLSLAALVTTLVVIVVIMSGGASRPAGHARVQANRPPSPSHVRSSRQATGLSSAAAPALAPPSAGGGAPPGAPSTSAGAPAASAEELDVQGHELLVQGSYARAVSRLLGAIRSSRQTLAGCIEPSSEACLTFAYALYDLGRALLLEGHHAEAVTVLSERLRIDDQRETVQRELELARRGSA